MKDERKGREWALTKQSCQVLESHPTLRKSGSKYNIHPSLDGAEIANITLKKNTFLLSNDLT